MRADQVVRSIHGPYICGDGIDIWEDSVLTASWLAHDALKVFLYKKEQQLLQGSWQCVKKGMPTSLGLDGFITCPMGKNRASDFFRHFLYRQST